MMPAKRFPSEAAKPTDSVAVDVNSQRKQPRLRRRAAQKRPKPAEMPRPENDSAMAAWGFAEYHRRRLQGETFAIDEWCGFFPTTCRNALRQALEMEARLAPSLPEPDCPNSNDETLDWPIEGEQRADFTILRELARGSIARVYLATEASTGGRLVVLKCSTLGEREARTLGRLAHPNVVPILSARRDVRSGLTLVCMPYLGSATLEDALEYLEDVQLSLPSRASFFRDVIFFHAQPEDPPLPIDPCLLHGSYTDGVIHLAVQLAETLAFLHHNGVCHRDLKPSNVLLNPSGKPLLLDFNLSQNQRETTPLLGGTLRYMPPEQLRAYMDQPKSDMDERVDFYSLALMVYELLGGVHPCDSVPADSIRPSEAGSMLKSLSAGFQPFREICPELERPVAALLDRCLALEASDRPGDAATLAATFKLQFTPARRLRRWLASHRRWLLAALGSALLVLAILTSVRAVLPPYSQREYDRGRIAYFANDFDSAEKHFDRALRAEPENVRFRYARGCARLQQSKYLPSDQARFDSILDDLTFTERGAADIRTLAVHAYVQLRSQKYDAAIKKYNLILRSGYQPIMALNNRAYGYFNAGRFKEAQIDLDRAVELGPPCQAVHYNRALLALQMRLQGNIQTIPPQALEDMEQALQLGAKTAALYRDATKLYAQAVSDDPRYSHFERALFYLRQAIAAGETPATFDPFPSLKEALKRSEFVALLDPNSPPISSQADVRLIDPVAPPE